MDLGQKIQILQELGLVAWGDRYLGQWLVILFSYTIDVSLSTKDAQFDGVTDG